MTRRRAAAVRTRGAIAALLLLCGMGCAGAPLLRTPSPSQRAPRTSEPGSAIGRVDLGGASLPDELVDPIQQRKSVLFARARLLEADRQPDKAAELYQDLLDQDPKHSAAWHRLAVVSAEQGELDAARDSFQQALRIAPENAELHSDYGYLCYLLQQWDEADRHLARAVALNPGFAPAHTNRGLVAARRGQTEIALAHFGRAGCSAEEARENLALAGRLNAADQTVQSPSASDAQAAAVGYARIPN